MKAYGLEWKVMKSSVFSHDLIHVRNPNHSWYDELLTYSVSSWHYLLFGPITLNDHIEIRSAKNRINLISGLPIEYSSLDELDIQLALAGKYDAVSDHA